MKHDKTAIDPRKILQRRYRHQFGLGNSLAGTVADILLQARR